MQRIQMLWPLPIVGPNRVTTQAYTIETLDDELSIMAMLQALPREEYSSFISSVLMLSQLTKEAVLEAFRTEEMQQHAAEEEATATAAAVAAATVRAIACYLCDGMHKVQDCPNLQTAHMQIKKDDNGSKSKKSRSRKGKQETKETKTESAKVEAGCDGSAVKAKAAVCWSALLTMSPPWCPLEYRLRRHIPYDTTSWVVYTWIVYFLASSDTRSKWDSNSFWGKRFDKAQTTRQGSE